VWLLLLMMMMMMILLNVVIVNAGLARIGLLIVSGLK
jgi:hypothetical protein